jgi:hypothetical protein
VFMVAQQMGCCCWGAWGSCMLRARVSKGIGKHGQQETQQQTSRLGKHIPRNACVHSDTAVVCGFVFLKIITCARNLHFVVYSGLELLVH